MKLFLSSLSINEEQKKYFENLVGKPMQDISFALIENAADPYPEESKNFVLMTRVALKSLGINPKFIDLSAYTNSEKLYTDLSQYDVVWFGGGNVFYLRYLMNKSGFDKIVKKLISDGVVYGGGSAGAIIAGPTLKTFDLVDDPSFTLKIVYEGLSLTNTVVIPHWGAEEFQSRLEEIEKYYKNTKYMYYTLSDKQALIINDNMVKVIP